MNKRSIPHNAVIGSFGVGKIRWIMIHQDTFLLSTAFRTLTRTVKSVETRLLIFEQWKQLGVQFDEFVCQMNCELCGKQTTKGDLIIFFSEEV